MAKLVTADFSVNTSQCILYYQTSNNHKISLREDAFDAEIQSHTYDQQGVIIFDKPITFIGKDFSRECLLLTEISIPYGVRRIENNAFSGCCSLKTIHIPNTVVYIGDNAFENSKSLESIQYSGNVCDWCKISFGYYNNATYRKKGIKIYMDGIELTDVVIPPGVKEIKANTFLNCSSLTSITIPESVTLIHGSAFGRCSSLKKINYLGDVTSWCKSNFHIGFNKEAKIYFNDKEVTEITIPLDITEINNSAFRDCHSLIKINYLGDLSSWCKIKFGNTTANPLSSGAKLYFKGKEVTEIDIPSDVTKINDYIFCGCSSVTRVAIPNSVTNIGYGAFSGCTSLTSVTIPDSVTSIGEYAFCDCTSLTSVTISNSVTSIENGTFSGCCNLTNVTIPNSVTSIGKYAFSNCSRLTSVTIPDSVTSIEETAFYKSTGALHVNSRIIENDIHWSNKETWLNNSYFSEITIGDNIRKIGNDVFNRLESLKKVTIAESVNSIGGSAFYGCCNLKEIRIPHTVSSVGDTAFKGCSSLPVIKGLRYADTYLLEAVDKSISSYEILEGTRWIGASAFRSTYSKSITIPKSIVSIGYQAFFCCQPLNVYISDLSAWCKINFLGKEASPLHIRGTKLLLNGKLLTDLVIPSDVTEVKHFAFYNYTALTSVTIPDSVTLIGERAFSGCENLECITLGKNVNRIEEEAFYHDSSIWGGVKLKTVTCKAEIPPTLKETSYGKGDYALRTFGEFDTLIIPKGCESAYAKSDWNRFITSERGRFVEEEYREYKEWQEEQRRLYGDYEEDIYDAEYESYLALGGDPEKYKKGCLDNFMDSQGF